MQLEAVKLRGYEATRIWGYEDMRLWSYTAMRPWSYEAVKLSPTFNWARKFCEHTILRQNGCKTTVRQKVRPHEPKCETTWDKQVRQNSETTVRTSSEKLWGCEAMRLWSWEALELSPTFHWAVRFCEHTNVRQQWDNTWDNMRQTVRQRETN
jgi:hypothetical protein